MVLLGTRLCPAVDVFDDGHMSEWPPNIYSAFRIVYMGINNSNCLLFTNVLRRIAREHLAPVSKIARLTQRQNYSIFQ